MVFRMLACTIGRVIEQRGRRCFAAERAIVAHIGPEPAGCAFSFREHRHGRVVTVNAFRAKNMLLDFVDERRQRRCGRADPAGERRDVEIDTFFRVDIALTVERKVRAIFGEQGNDLKAQIEKGEYPGIVKTTLDGFDQRDYLEGKSDKSARDYFFYYSGSTPSAVRYKNWKMYYTMTQPGAEGWS